MTTRTLRRMMLAFFLSLSVGMGASCALFHHAPPNLTPQAVVAFHGTQVIKALDIVRDTAHASHLTVPPLITAQTDLMIVTWHQQAIVIVHATPAGWKQTVLASLDALKAQLSPHDWAIIAPYVALARTLLNEVN